MGTRIDIQVGQALLGQRVRDLAALNREQRIEREQRVRESSTTQEALDAGVANAAQRGQAQNGQLRNSVIGDSLRPGQYQERLRAQGKKSDVPEYYTAPKVAVTPQGGLEFAVGWQVPLSNEQIAIVSGDAGSAVNFDISAPPSLADPVVEGTPYSTSGWVHQDPLPGDTEAGWRRTRLYGAAEFTIPSTATDVVSQSVALPAGRTMIYAIRQAAKTTTRLSRFSVESPDGFNALWLEEYVYGPATTSAEELLDTPSTYRRLIVQVQGVSLFSAAFVGNTDESVDYDSRLACVIGKSAVRQVAIPAALDAAIVAASGNPVGPSNLPVPALVDAGFEQVVALGSRQFEGRGWLVEVTARVMPGYNALTGNGSTGANANLQSLLSATPVGSYGLGWISSDSASMLPASDRVGTPAVYKLLSGELSPTASRFHPGGDLWPLGACQAFLSPLPKQFAWIDVRPGGVDPSLFYSGIETQSPFSTYRPTLDNARNEDPYWSGFSGDGKPAAPGKPAHLKHHLRPLAERVAPGAGYAPALIFAAAFGDTVNCRQRLIALGFTAADLAP